MKKKYYSLLLVVLGLVIFTAACSQDSGKIDSKGEGDAIIIGGLAPLTGDVAIYGQTAANGAKLAFEEINKNGGVLGRELVYLLEDEKGDPTEALNAYGKLLDAGMDILLGDITSKPTEVVAEYAKSDGIPMLTPTGTQFSITKDRENVFRVCYTDPFQGQVLARYAVEKLGAKTAAVMKNTSSDYSDGVGKSFIEEAEKLGLEIVALESYGQDDKDFRSQLTKIRSKQPDVLLMPDYYETIALMAPQARELGLESMFLGPDGWDGVARQIDKSSYEAIEGAVFTNHYSVKDENPRVQNFLKAYEDKYKEEASAFAALAYDGVYMIKEALEKAGSTDSQAVISALKTIEFTGVTGGLRFDQDNNPIKNVSMIKIVNGDYSLDQVMEIE